MLQSLLPLRFSPFSRKLKSALNKGRLKVALFYTRKYWIICLKITDNVNITRMLQKYYNYIKYRSFILTFFEKKIK